MLEWIPDKSAFCRDKDCTLDVLVRIRAPRQPEAERRPDINLCLVIDRSGSMGGEKINLTRQAAKLVARSLSPTDFLGIVLFGDHAEVLLPSSRVTDKDAIVKLVDRILVNGSTALHQGWKTGAAQACLNLDEPRLHRVVLLTDGQANVGETNPDRICDEVHKICQQGVQTTTMGFGRDYNENLLRSVATSGEGNHFFVETPDQLVKFFELELDGLAATVGTRVRLRLRGLAEGVAIEPLGEVQTVADGSFQLADITVDYPIEQLFRITVPASASADAPLQAELTWNSPRTGALENLVVPLLLPRLTMEERLELPTHPEVEKQLVIAMAARARREALVAMNGGDQAGATRILKEALDFKELPDQEKSQLEQLRTTVERGDQSASSKLATSQSHSYSRGSVVLHNLDVTFLEGMVGQGTFPLRLGAAMNTPGEPRPWERAAAMLRGLFAGEGFPSGKSPGTAGQLNLAVLSLLDGQNRILLSQMAGLAKKLAAAPLESPSDSFLAFRKNVEDDRPFVEMGIAAPDCGAVLRVPAMLVTRCKNPMPRMWTQLALSSFLTHNDAASMACCLAFGMLLWELMGLDAPPPPDFYLARFATVLGELETERKYPSRAPRHDGWEGRLSEYLNLLLKDARGRKLSISQALQEWGTSDYLLECIPSWLYILEQHGGEPAEARRVAAHYSPSLGALTGAAMGALHGDVYAERSPELEEALARVASKLP